MNYRDHSAFFKYSPPLQTCLNRNSSNYPPSQLEIFFFRLSACQSVCLTRVTEFQGHVLNTYSRLRFHFPPWPTVFLTHFPSKMAFKSTGIPYIPAYIVRVCLCLRERNHVNATTKQQSFLLTARLVAIFPTIAFSCVWIQRNLLIFRITPDRVKAWVEIKNMGLR